MNRAGRGALAVILVVLFAALTFIIARPRAAPTKAQSEKPSLLLLTSLPLLFGEDFSLKGSGSPALARLSAQYRVVPISTTSPAELGKGRLLLMAQPLAQTPENLVALDEWVRSGGRVLLLADPMLEWPGGRPLGDPLRPPPMFSDTGLLGHWGLRLDAPDGRGPAPRKLAGYRILTVSPGALYGSCVVSDDRLVADCRTGKGRAVVVADADLLNVADLGVQGRDNLVAVMKELAALVSR